MRQDKRQYTLEESTIANAVRQAYPGAGPWFIAQAVAAEIERRRSQDRDRQTRRDDPRQCALSL